MSLQTITQSVSGILILFSSSMTCALGNASAGNELPKPTVLELHSGDFVRGQLLGIDDNTLEWKAEFFSRPLQFPLDRVAGMHRTPEPNITGEGEFIVELTNRRDVLFGDLLAIGKNSVDLRSKRLGVVNIRRDVVRRISRNGQDGRLYPVPTRLDGWTKSSDDHWSSEGTTITSDTIGATLYADVNLPTRSMIEVELVWKNAPSSPGFGLHFGTSEQTESLETAFSIEIWENQLVAQRREARLADVAALGSAATGSCHLFVYMNQLSGQMTVYDAKGGFLGQIKVPPTDPAAAVPTGITLVNRKGNLQLKQLRVRGWSGMDPSQAAKDGSISVALNDELHICNDLRIEKREVSMKQRVGVRKLDLDDVNAISFRTASTNAEHQAAVTWQDGTRISGDLVSATTGEIVMKSYMATEPIHLPLRGLQSLLLGKKKVERIESPTNRRVGTIELMDTRMVGWLVEAERESSGSCLVWQAAEALAPSPLKKDVYGRILYVKPPHPVKKSPPNPSAREQQFVFRAAGFGARSTPRTKVKTRNKALAGTAVHLRTGDTIPCKVTSIDDGGVHIESDLTESQAIPHEQMKAAQLTPTVAMPLLAKAKRQRLLTLPRMQRDVPPQHLLFSPQGDVLRGSILSMSGPNLDLELRLDKHRIPRKRVAAIVWLHEDEVSQGPDNEANQPKDSAAGREEVADEIQVQVIGSSGSRFSVVARSFSDETIHGYSDILKNVHAGIGEIDQLLLGGFIHRAARTLPYHRWRLSAARDPKFVTAGDEDTQETTPGTESNLVGAPAPPIKLKMLDGEDFRLSDHLGHCVVLDFWASWCGPCLQVMPQVDQVVSEFADHDVRLFAINLEETADKVRATLERRQLDLPVALDRDGVAAARYEATAIPQTVVIGPDGTVARVFVGSSRKFAEQLKAALAELTQAEKVDRG